ncbi:MAG: hypothetical protein SPF22_07385 [Candidatus Onthovivens sp.]|nr:hypothetical protein [Candidatus Onthovivens sp.]
MMSDIPKIKLKDLDQDRINKIKDGSKIFDVETEKYYEKRNGVFQEMIEEQDTGEKENIVPLKDVDIKMIEDVKASGNKIEEVNLFMRLITAKNQLNAQKKSVNQKVNYILKCPREQIDLIQLRTSEVTYEAIKSASYDQIKEFFTIDGNLVELNFNDDLSDSDKEAGYKDFLEYLKNIQDMVIEIDAQIKEIDALCEYFSDDIKEKSKSVYTWDKFIYDIFKKAVEDKNTPEDERNRIQRVIEAREDALTLNPMKEYIKEEIALGRRKSIIYAYNNRFQNTLERAEKYAFENDFRLIFKMYDAIEETFGYDQYRNFFVFLFARYVKYNNTKFSKIDNSYIVQISQNLIMLKKNELPDPERSIFVNAIKEIIDLVLNPQK